MTHPDGQPSEARQRYLNAMHGVQSATAWAMACGTKTTETKHMRVGIDSAHISDAGLASLLIQKGVFTLAEYEEAMAVAAEREVALREAEACQELNVAPGTITFG